MSLSEKDLTDLRYARNLLENQSFGIKLLNIVGVPIEKGLEYLPVTWSEKMTTATEKAVRQALDVAVMTIWDPAAAPSNDMLHKLIATLSGGAGGLFGLPALTVELPFSTVVMLRSVADIARSEGEDIRQIETRLSCLEVFALGGRPNKDGNEGKRSDSAYFGARMALSKAVNEAAAFIMERGIVSEGAPVLLRLITQIASRYGIVVSEKLALSSLPVIGAAGGALINSVFMDHFQDTARGHFVVRRLERTHGADVIEEAYRELQD